MSQNRRPATKTPTHSGRPRTMMLVGSVVLLGGLVAAISISEAAGQAAIREQKTGRTGPMGGPVLNVPMERTGVSTAAGVEVTGAEIAMGDVRLDVTVEPSWTLVNTTSNAVSIGEPHASVVEGCCPGPLTIDARILQPGESAVLSFPLQMHHGMDGPHRFRIHVPVGDAVLELGVTGDFDA